MKPNRLQFNPVAKYARKYNTAKVFVNQKSRAMRGYMKHKNNYKELS